MVEPGVLANGAQCADQEGEDGGEQERGAHQFQRGRQSLEDHLRDRAGRRKADAQVAPHRGPDPAHVLDVDGLIHSQPSPVRLDDGGVDEAARLQKGSLRAAGRRLDDREQDDRDAQEQRHHLEDAPSDVCGHGAGGGAYMWGSRIIGRHTRVSQPSRRPVPFANFGHVRRTPTHMPDSPGVPMPSATVTARRAVLAVCFAVLPSCSSSSLETDVESQVIETVTFAPSLGIDLSEYTRLPSSGIYTLDIVEGTGQQLVTQDFATVRYTAWLTDGTVVYQGPRSWQLGNFEQPLGMEYGSLFMRIGGVRRLIVPPSLAWGDFGSDDGRVPPGAVVIFEVELEGLASP